MALQSSSWRKQHPVLSRVVLYAIGAGVVALLVILLKDRESIDQADKHEALRQQLIQMPGIVMNLPKGHHEVLRLLGQDEFQDPDLPDRVKSMVERTRALAQMRWYQVELGMDTDKALAMLAESQKSFARAKELAPAQDLAGLLLEWAEKKLTVDDPDGAQALLQSDGVTWEPTSVGIMHAYMLAAVSIQRGEDKVDAVRSLGDHLKALKAPLSSVEDLNSGGRPWSAVEAAVVATERIARWRTGQDDPSIWQHLLKLAPQSANAHVRAAAGYAAYGHEKMALSAWARAVDLDKDMAEGLAGKAVELRDLRTLLEKSGISLQK